MCKSIQDSILSLGLSYFTGAVLIATGKPKYIWLGAFVLIIGSMQGVDTVIWYMKNHSIPTKEFTKYAVFIVLALEPLVAYLGYIYYSGNRMPLFEIAYMLFFTFMAFTWFKNCKETTVTADGYLKWCDITFKSLFNRTFYMCLLFYPFIYFPDILLRNVLMISCLGLWLYNLNHEAFGSRWCYSFGLLDGIILGNLALRG